MNQPEKRSILNLVKKGDGEISRSEKKKFVNLMIVDRGKAASGVLGLKTERQKQSFYGCRQV